MTDMLRCLASGAERYITMTTDWDQFRPDDYGWGDNPFSPERGAALWEAPWGVAQIEAN